MTVGILWALAAATALGFFTFTLKVVENVNPYATELYVRAAGMIFVVFLLAYFFCRGSLQVSDLQSPLAWYAVAGGSALVLADLFLLRSFQHLEFGYIGITIMVGGSLVVATVLSMLLLGETMNAAKALGFAAVIGGVILLSVF